MSQINGTDYSGAGLPVAIPAVAHLPRIYAPTHPGRTSDSADPGSAEEKSGTTLELYAVIGVFAVEGLRLAVYLWAGGGDVRELTEIFRTIAGNPSAVKDLLPILPTLALVWLIYRMHQQNDRNFREVIKVIRDVGKVINENTSALDRVNEREDEADRRKRH